MTIPIPAAMIAADVATQAEIDALDTRLDTLEIDGRMVQMVNLRLAGCVTRI